MDVQERLKKLGATAQIGRFSSLWCQHLSQARGDLALTKLCLGYVFLSLPGVAPESSRNNDLLSREAAPISQSLA
jgi:hypothetical protein